MLCGAGWLSLLYCFVPALVIFVLVLEATKQLRSLKVALRRI